eukprot:Sspe_Gene.95724::Locus_68023_Transcript_1_1_Confidence_1.000_Length_2639::g.95724::m.95724
MGIWLLLAVLAPLGATGCPTGMVAVGVLEGGGQVCEDFTELNGTIVLPGGVVLGKRVYQQTTDATWGGYQQSEVLQGSADLLARAMLRSGGEPDFDAVYAALPSLIQGWGAATGYAGQHTFVSSRGSTGQAIFDHLGDSGPWAGYPRPVNVIPKEEYSGATVHEGLVGGHLIIPHFTYTTPSARWELTIVPEADTDDNAEQAVFFRFVRVRDGNVTHTRYFDTYSYAPGYTTPPSAFYTALANHHAYWNTTWSKEGVMTVGVPSGVGEVLVDQAVHSLARDMVTRAGTWWPRYGVCGDPGGCAYGDPHNNGFPEIFTASMTAALEWGAFPYAAGVLDNYLRYYVRSNGRIHYRGLEMAQVGRILTVTAMYYRYTNDPRPLVTHFPKLEGLYLLLKARREQARARYVASDPRYGMPVGNDEADLFTNTVSGMKTELPFYSIATEMWRGVRDLGGVFVDVGRRENRSDIESRGAEMVGTAAPLRADLLNSLALSQNGTCWPYVAGGRVCDEVVAPSIRDAEPWRTYAEMLYSGALPDTIASAIADWNGNNSRMMRMGVLSGTGSDCCGNMIATFTSHGWSYGLLVLDRIPAYLLHMYTIATHGYTQGTWTAPEETSIQGYGMPYATAAQLSTPLNVKWALVFTDPSGWVWVARALPKAFALPVTVREATTPYGRISFTHRGDSLAVILPNTTSIPALLLRFTRCGGSTPSPSVNGRPVQNRFFNVATRTLTLPPSTHLHNASFPRAFEARC